MQKRAKQGTMRRKTQVKYKNAMPKKKPYSTNKKVIRASTSNWFTFIITKLSLHQKHAP